MSETWDDGVDETWIDMIVIERRSADSAEWWRPATMWAGWWADRVPALNRMYGWEKFRVVSGAEWSAMQDEQDARARGLQLAQGDSTGMVSPAALAAVRAALAAR